MSMPYYKTREIPRICWLLLLSVTLFVDPLQLSLLSAVDPELNKGQIYLQSCLLMLHKVILQYYAVDFVLIVCFAKYELSI